MYYKGEIKNYPLQVVDKMLQRQLDCGNERNVEVFEKNRFAGKSDGGFDWGHSIEGTKFWYEVIAIKCLGTFFNLYPKIINEPIQTDKMEKKILGYKLINPKYREAAQLIGNFKNIESFERYNTLSNSSAYEIIANMLKDAGVLDLWFEPIYMTKDVIYTMGQDGDTFELTVRDGKVVHGEEDITDYVNTVQGYKSTLGFKKFYGYEFVIEDLIISKTGCENKKTLLSEWLAIKL